MKLLKNDYGALQLIYTGAEAIKNTTVIPSGKMQRLSNNAGVRFRDSQGALVDVLLSQVSETQIGNSGTPVAFTGGIADLEDFMNANFFF